MGVFELLSDDHSLLNSQVIHVVALLKSHVEKDFKEEALELEVIRQLELLCDQLVEHFEFEEDTVYPELEARHPELNAQFGVLRVEHEEILHALQALQASVAERHGHDPTEEVLSKLAAFETVFQSHAAGEARLFDQLAATVGKR